MEGLDITFRKTFVLWKNKTAGDFIQNILTRQFQHIEFTAKWDSLMKYKLPFKVNVSFHLWSFQIV